MSEHVAPYRERLHVIDVASPFLGGRAGADMRWLLEQLRERDRDLADAENALWDASRALGVAITLGWREDDRETVDWHNSASKVVARINEMF